MRRPVKKNRERDDPARAPLEWLIDFANIGLDRTQPRGPTGRLTQSPFLDRYTRDPTSDAVIAGSGDARVEYVTQERRPGVSMRWLSIRGHHIPLPDRYGSCPAYRPEVDPDHTPFATLLSRLLAALPRPRDVMPVPDEELRWTRPPGAEGRDEDEIPRAFWQLQTEIRDLLASLWTLSREKKKPGAYRGLSDENERTHALLHVEAVIDGIGQTCLGRITAPVSRFLGLLGAMALEDLDDDADGDTLVNVGAVLHAYYNLQLIDRNRAPVWVEPDGGFSFVADALPGVVWAEAMNLLSIRDCRPGGAGVSNPILKALVCCGWCGAFSLPRGRPRRPREFCPGHDCRRRYYGRGRHPRRVS